MVTVTALNIQVAHMTRSPPTLIIDSVMLGPVILIIAQYTRLLPEYWVLCLALVSTSGTDSGTTRIYKLGEIYR